MAIAYGLLEPTELTLPHLPRGLEGMRIVHLSDLHIRRSGSAYTRLETQLTSQRFDLIVFTGDYIDRADRGQEARAHEVLHHLAQRLRPRFGTFGVFGNHDTPLLREQCQDVAIHWLSNTSHHVPDRPIELLGLDMLKDEQPDSVTLVLQRTREQHAQHEKQAEARERAAARHEEVPRPLAPDERPLRLMLAHEPGALPLAADLGVDLLMCGHTHGGQCRLPTGHALINACDLPLRLTSGVLRCRNTLAGVSRGLGWTGFVPRICCRPHLPVYTLRRGALPGNYSEHMQNLHPW